MGAERDRKRNPTQLLASGSSLSGTSSVTGAQVAMPHGRQCSVLETDRSRLWTPQEQPGRALGAEHLRLSDKGKVGWAKANEDSGCQGGEFGL